MPLHLQIATPYPGRHPPQHLSGRNAIHEVARDRAGIGLFAHRGVDRSGICSTRKAILNRRRAAASWWQRWRRTRATAFGTRRRPSSSPITCRSAGVRCWPPATRPIGHRSSVRARRIFRVSPSRIGRRLLRQALAKSKEQEVPRPPRRPSAASKRDHELPRFGTRAGLLSGRSCRHLRHIGRAGFCSRMILDPGDEVWVEEPGFVEARWALTAAGAKLVPVPVDDRGLVVLGRNPACARRAADRGDAIASISLGVSMGWSSVSSCWTGRTRTTSG